MLDEIHAVHGVFALPFTSTLLGAVFAHDVDTHYHLLNVALLALRVARHAGLSQPESIVLGQAGLFHDIGKVRIPASLLNARHTLSEDEWDVLRAHPATGEQMLRANGAHGLAAIIRSHHERLDGSGYPDGLRGLAISPETRLLSVVDAYDAMRACRPYAPSIAQAEAFERLTAARTLFDRDAVDALIRALDESSPTPEDARLPIATAAAAEIGAPRAG
jgi:HD-GYP domain-containing protein (c-di-GMP phosphodiesterase class II)